MKPTVMRFSFRAMGSFCELQLCGDSRSASKKIAAQLSEEVERLEKKYTRFNSESVLSRINATAGAQNGVEIDAETAALLQHARNCYQNSDGLFDVTAAALNELWDFKNAIMPSQEQVELALTLVGFDRLAWNDSRFFLPAGMQIDFGGIVKEYAADSAARLARSLGVAHGLVNLGGDFSVIGPMPDNTPWPVAIASGEPQDEIMARIALLDGGLASSGDYERCFVHEGKRYSHILNPKTGWPCAGLEAVSVAANLCTVAGSVATIAMLKDEPDAKAWLAESGLPHVYRSTLGGVGGSGLISRPK